MIKKISILLTVVFIIFNLFAIEANAMTNENKAKKELKNSYYDYIIVVGDSRTYASGKYLGKDKTIKKKVKFIGTSGKEHDFLVKPRSNCKTCGCKVSKRRATEYSKLEKSIARYRLNHPDGKIAVIFNYGLNEIRRSNISNGKYSIDDKKTCLYDCMMSHRMLRLKKRYKCDFYYDSINPIKPQVNRTTEQVLDMNNFIKNNLGSEYTYVDTYSCLQSADNCGFKDNTHYDTDTYYKILFYELSIIDEIKGYEKQQANNKNKANNKHKALWKVIKN